jgi:hypothetical protein
MDNRDILQVFLIYIQYINFHISDYARIDHYRQHQWQQLTEGIRFGKFEDKNEPLSWIVGYHNLIDNVKMDNISILLNEKYRI